MAEQLCLASSVHACREGGTYVLLDLRGDRYYFAPVEGDADPIAESAMCMREISTGAGAARRLIALGLAAPSDPRGSFLAERLDDLSGAKLLRACDVLRFLSACLWARKVLRRGRLDLALAQLRLRACHMTRAAEDVASTCERFERLRPFFPKRRVCLFDSLALADFLIASGVHAELVFGVRTGPFAAHSWVEWAGCPLNDRMGQAAGFSVILGFSW